MKTTIIKPVDIQRKWVEIDATGVTLGKLAVKVADILRGKNKPFFSPHMDCGDYVIITNCDKVHLTGNKLDDKKYYNHSGFQSGLRTRTAKEMLDKWPEELVTRAVKGMLPKNKLNRAIIKKLNCYRGDSHSHIAQKPVKITI